jgi:hypothetical protein
MDLLRRVVTHAANEGDEAGGDRIGIEQERLVRIRASKTRINKAHPSKVRPRKANRVKVSLREVSLGEVSLGEVSLVRGARERAREAAVPDGGVVGADPNLRIGLPPRSRRGMSPKKN